MPKEPTEKPSGVKTATKAILGFLLTVYLVPLIGSSISNYQSLNQLQLQKKSELFANHTLLSSKINTLSTTLGLYIDHTDSIHCREIQQQLRKDMNAAYIDYDKYAWWWLDNYKAEMYGYDFVDIKYDKQFNGVISRYKQNLSKSTHAMDSLWDACLNPLICPRFDTSRQYSLAKVNIPTLRKQMDARLCNLADTLNHQIDTIAWYMFSKDVRYWRLLRKELTFQ